MTAPATDAFAQRIELVSVSGQYMPNADMVAAPGKVQVSSYDAAAAVPVPLTKKTFLIPGLAYHMDAVSFADTKPEFVELRAFHSAEVSALFVQLLPRDWSISARFAPGLAGDFAEIDGRMIRLSAVAMASHAFSKAFVLGFGGITTYSFGTFLPLPAAYVSWRPFEGFQAEAFLPAFAQVHYTIAKRVRFGVLADFKGNEYAIRDERIRSAWPCAGAAVDDPTTPADERGAVPAECFDNLAYSVGSAGVTASVRLFSSLWLTTMAGHSFFRRFDQRNAERDLVTDGRQDLPNVFVFRAGIVWWLPTADD